MSWKEDFQRAEENFRKKWGTRLGVEGIVSRVFEQILLKSISEPFSVCSRTWSALQTHCWDRKVLPTEHTPEKSHKPASSQAEGAVSSARCGEARDSASHSSRCRKTFANTMFVHERFLGSIFPGEKIWESSFGYFESYKFVLKTAFDGAGCACVGAEVCGNSLY